MHRNTQDLIFMKTIYLLICLCLVVFTQGCKDNFVGPTNYDDNVIVSITDGKYRYDFKQVHSDPTQKNSSLVTKLKVLYLGTNPISQLTLIVSIYFPDSAQIQSNLILRKSFSITETLTAGDSSIFTLGNNLVSLLQKKNIVIKIISENNIGSDYKGYYEGTFYGYKNNTVESAGLATAWVDKNGECGFEFDKDIEGIRWINGLVESGQFQGNSYTLSGQMQDIVTSTFGAAGDTLSIPFKFTTTTPLDSIIVKINRTAL